MRGKETLARDNPVAFFSIAALSFFAVLSFLTLILLDWASSASRRSKKTAQEK